MSRSSPSAYSQSNGRHAPAQNGHHASSATGEAQASEPVLFAHRSPKPRSLKPSHSPQLIAAVETSPSSTEYDASALENGGSLPATHRHHPHHQWTKAEKLKTGFYAFYSVAAGVPSGGNNFCGQADIALKSLNSWPDLGKHLQNLHPSFWGWTKLGYSFVSSTAVNGMIAYAYVGPACTELGNTVKGTFNLIFRPNARKEDKIKIADLVIRTVALIPAVANVVIFGDVAMETFSFMGPGLNWIPAALNTGPYGATRWKATVDLVSSFFIESAIFKAYIQNALQTVSTDDNFSVQVDGKENLNAALLEFLKVFLDEMQHDFKGTQHFRRSNWKRTAFFISDYVVGLPLSLTAIPPWAAFGVSLVKGVETISGEKLDIGATRHYDNPASLGLGLGGAAQSLIFYGRALWQLPREVIYLIQNISHLVASHGRIKSAVKWTLLAALLGALAIDTGLGVEGIAKGELENGDFKYAGASSNNWEGDVILYSSLTAATLVNLKVCIALLNRWISRHRADEITKVDLRRAIALLMYGSEVPINIESLRDKDTGHAFVKHQEFTFLSWLLYPLTCCRSSSPNEETQGLLEDSNSDSVDANGDDDYDSQQVRDQNSVNAAKRGAGAFKPLPLDGVDTKGSRRITASKRDSFAGPEEQSSTWCSIM